MQCIREKLKEEKCINTTRVQKWERRGFGSEISENETSGIIERFDKVRESILSSLC